MTRRRRYRVGPPLSRERAELAAAHHGLAARLAAAEARRSRLDPDELLSAALRQLVSVAAWFDPSRGVPFPALVCEHVPRRLRQLRGRLGSRREVAASQLPGADESPFDPPAPPDPPPAGELFAEARRLLPAPQWEALSLRFAHGLDLREVGERMGVSYQRAGQRVAAALRRLAASPLLRRAAAEAGIVPGEE